MLGYTILFGKLYTYYSYLNIIRRIFRPYRLIRVGVCLRRGTNFVQLLHSTILHWNLLDVRLRTDVHQGKLIS